MPHPYDFRLSVMIIYLSITRFNMVVFGTWRSTTCQVHTTCVVEAECFTRNRQKYMRWDLCCLIRKRNSCWPMLGLPRSIDGVCMRCAGVCCGVHIGCVHACGQQRAERVDLRQQCEGTGQDTVCCQHHTAPGYSTRNVSAMFIVMNCFARLKASLQIPSSLMIFM